MALLNNFFVKRPPCLAAFSTLLFASVLFSSLVFAEFPVLAAKQGAEFSPVIASSLPPAYLWGDKISNPQSVIVCIHGLGLHKGSFDEFGRLMASKNIPVYAFDVRGFGDWHLKGDDNLDLAQTLEDAKSVLESVRKRYPQASIFLLGESMGGAIALHVTAKYPELVDGLISAVPSGDRWSGLGSDLKVGLHVLAGGFGERFEVGSHVVKHATKQNEALRERWSKDPASRTKYSPDELIAFQNFMNKNNEAAANVKSTPVLILQGVQDKLVRPAGSFKIWDHLATADRTFAASKSSEHLIFEYGQFSPNDLKYLLSWIGKQKGPKTDQSVGENPPELPKKQEVPSKDELVASAPVLKDHEPASKTNSADLVTKVSSRTDLPSLSYWIELMRDGKRYRCNNKTAFKSGDEIRIHLICSLDGYAYILMKRGTSGAHAVLFPEERTGRNNVVKAAKDYALPSATWLKFDKKAGIEKVGLVFSKTPLDPDTNKYLNNKQTVIVSSDRSGAKDLCPTRMQISWDDPNPMIIPGAVGSDFALALDSSSLVKISPKEDSNSLIAVDIDLEHLE